MAKADWSARSSHRLTRQARAGESQQARGVEQVPGIRAVLAGPRLLEWRWMLLNPYVFELLLRQRRNADLTWAEMRRQLRGVDTP